MSSSGKGLVEFPDVEAKLQRPTKKSAFEKQRAEAEAKRQREAAETAAVYEDFVKSFDRDEDDGYGFGGGRFDNASGHGGSNPSAGGNGTFPPRHPRDNNPKPPLGFGGASGAAIASRRHFGAPSAPKSGPGSLGPTPASYGRKRGYEAYQQGSARDRDRDRDARGILGFDDRDDRDRDREGKSISKAFHNSDDEEEGGASTSREEMAVARPTLRLAHLPPGTSPAVIRALIPGHLSVENVKIVPPSGPAGTGTERKSTVAVVTLSQDVPANEIDATVSALQNKYLGYGYYLSLHRHLSSAVAASTASASLTTGSAGAQQPFGAKPVPQPSGPSGNAAMQNAFHRGFAPPTSYGPPGQAVNRSGLLHVAVHPPNDIQQLQLINMVIESVLAHGPEFEALLMSRPEVQKEEKWAWIWDARSEGGVWYRWRLWEIVTGSPGGEKQSQKGRFVPLFEGGHAWKAPEKPLAYEFTTRIDEFVSDEDYVSSDEDDYEDGPRENTANEGEAEDTFLNPLEKAKLTHLLARLPTTLSRIRKGDIARITAFALTHASRGVDEVVDMILRNIETPISLTSANPHYHRDNTRGKDKDKNHANDSERSSPEPVEDRTAATSGDAAADTSGASLVGLYVVSDILSSSSTSGLRHAWRFRQLFDVALRERKTFEMLGSMAERLQWGRLRAEKWKRSVGLVLGLWEGWCVFPVESQELFVKSFEHPPSSRVEEERAETEEGGKKGRWKTVEATRGDERGGLKLAESSQLEHTPQENLDPVGEPMADDDVAGEPMEDDVEGEPMSESDVEGEPLGDEDVDGEPMGDDDVEGEPMEEDDNEEQKQEQAEQLDQPSAKMDAPAEEAHHQPAATVGGLQLSSKLSGGQRRRMRAVDMFADSDGEEER